MNQVNGSGDNLGEQARPLLQVEDIREATGGQTGLLDSRDLGFFIVDLPNFWERPELSRYLRDVRDKPDKHTSRRNGALLQQMGKSRQKAVVVGSHVFEEQRTS